jgi:hypothetical protein
VKRQTCSKIVPSGVKTGGGKRRGVKRHACSKMVPSGVKTGTLACEPRKRPAM